MRRRRPDAWTGIEVGDIVSFDTQSSRCPNSAYVRGITTRSDGKVVLSGTMGETIVEHASYRMRLDQRPLTTRLQEAGAIDGLAGWNATLWFDWEGRRSPVIRMDPMPLPVPVWMHWDGPLLLVSLWTPPERQDFTDMRADAMVLRDGELVLPSEGGSVTSAQTGERLKAFGDPTPFDELFATPIRRFGRHGDEPTAGVRETLTAVARWLEEHRVELQDPQVAMPRRILA